MARLVDTRRHAKITPHSSCGKTFCGKSSHDTILTRSSGKIKLDTAGLLTKADQMAVAAKEQFPSRGSR